MKIPAYKSCDYLELWKITEWKDGCIFKVENTGFHLKYGTPVPKGYTTHTISCKPEEIININLVTGTL